MDKNIVLKLENISKSFPGVKALSNVEIELYAGEIHGLLGENGAGKSTLLNIINGVCQQDSGSIYINNSEVMFDGPRSAINKGIAYVHQELSLIPNLSVCQNVFLGYEPVKMSWVQNKEMAEMTLQYLNKMNFYINPYAIVSDLNTQQRQIVEICKALARDPKIVAFDEPTGLLMENQIDNLYKIMNNMKKHGVAILFVTHELKEVFAVTDRITVLRDGKKINTVVTSNITEDEIIKMMVGKSIKTNQAVKGKVSDNKMLSLRDLSLHNCFTRINLDLYKGEILGIAGIIGSGRVKLAESIFGLRKIDSGEMLIMGNKIEIDKPIDAINCGIGYIPSDRNIDGLMLNMSIENNIFATITNEVKKLGTFINKNFLQKKVDKLIRNMNIKTTSRSELINNLSGGNRQKVLISKWLAKKLPILIFNEPTHGVDIGARAEIHNELLKLSNNGVSIILISSDLYELMNLSDRMYIMNKGQIVSEYKRNLFNEEEIMKLAATEIKKRDTFNACK